MNLMKILRALEFYNRPLSRCEAHQRGFTDFGADWGWDQRLVS